MQNNLSQNQSLLLKQTLSLKQIQYLKLLAMNVTELGGYLNSLYEENPVIDLSAPVSDPVSSARADSSDIISWLNRSGNTASPAYGSDDEQQEITPKGQIQDDRVNLMTHLRSQFDVSLRDFDIGLMELLLGSLDKRGYLIVDEKRVASKGYDLELVYEAISYLQSLDPAGIGARNLAECLCIQMRRKGETDEDVFSIINEHLEDLSKGHFQKIAKILGCDAEKVNTIYEKIKKCNPIPASGFGNEVQLSYIIPDVTVIDEGNGLTIRYNQNFQPQISINQNYVDLASKSDETKEYINKKTQQALWVLKAVDSRRVTIEKIVSCIVKAQEEFFMGGNDLAPLKLKDIANELSIHESTVSRAINEKYLECKQGIFPLKHFFTGEVSQSVETGSEGHVSTRSLEKRIEDIIAGENPDKPYSDSEIIKILESDGIMIARRTVAKYRSNLGIKSSSMRKKDKKKN